MRRDSRARSQKTRELKAFPSITPVLSTLHGNVFCESASQMLRKEVQIPIEYAIMIIPEGGGDGMGLQF